VTTGRVVRYEARASIIFVQPDGTDQVVEFVIDTGFSGIFTLPVEHVNELQLARSRSVAIRLADDHIVDVEAYSGLVRWGTEVIEVEVLATGSRPLLGTRFLRGHELCIVFTDQGSVSIRPVLAE
jgi:clan AA aspartic protease